MMSMIERVLDVRSERKMNNPDGILTPESNMTSLTKGVSNCQTELACPDTYAMPK